MEIALGYSAVVRPTFLRDIEEAIALDNTGDPHYSGKIGAHMPLLLL
jgi:hypothetical protein